MIKFIEFDFNKILSLINLTTLISFIYCINNFNPNYRYFELDTIFIILLFIIQIHFFLFYEAYNRNPLILVLCFIFIVFYNLRFTTFFIDPSLVFALYKNVNINYVLLYIISANFLIFFGLRSYGFRRYKIKYSNSGTIINNYFPHFFILISLSFQILSSFSVPILSQLLTYISVFLFNTEALVLLSFVLFFLSKNKLDQKAVLSFYLIVIIYLIYFSLAGRRGTILNIFIFYLFSLLAIDRNIKFKFLNILFVIFVIPISFLIFIISTFLRNLQLINSAFNSNLSVIDILKNSIDNLTSFKINYDLNLLIPIFDRISYLDFTSYYITYSEKFNKIFSFSYYFQSVVDNFLTPGFNIFDSPRVSNALFLLKNDIVVNFSNLYEDYNSVQFGIHSELYNLLGLIPSLFFFYLIGYFFSYKYYNFEKNEKSMNHYKRSILLFTFYLLINSYGIDWMIIYFFSIYMTFLLFKKLSSLYIKL